MNSFGATDHSVDEGEAFDDGLVAIVVCLHGQTEVWPSAAASSAQAKYHLHRRKVGVGFGPCDPAQLS